MTKSQKKTGYFKSRTEADGSSSDCALSTTLFCFIGLVSFDVGLVRPQVDDKANHQTLFGGLAPTVYTITLLSQTLRPLPGTALISPLFFPWFLILSPMSPGVIDHSRVTRSENHLPLLWG